MPALSLRPALVRVLLPALTVVAVSVGEGWWLGQRQVRQPTSVDPRREAAAGTLGASRPWVFFTVTLPLILPGIVAGAILGFAKAMGEFGATITFVANIPGQTQTLPSAIYAYLQVPGGDAAAFRLVLVAIAIAMLALLLSEWVGRSVARRIAGA